MGLEVSDQAVSSVKRQRVVYYDYLRVLATFAVVLIHEATGYFQILPVGSYSWQIGNLYNSLMRWAVPVFVMISGAIFLGRKIDTKKLYAKNILRLVIAYFVWSMFYAWLHQPASFSQFVQMTFAGEYHMWFVPMIIGLYICAPIINQIIQNRTAMKYYLAVAFVVAFLLPQLTLWLNDLGGPRIQVIASGINYLLAASGLNLVLGYTSYFILGYFLSQQDLPARTRHIIYALGIIGVVVTAGTTLLVSSVHGAHTDAYYESFRLSVLCESIAIFVWLKHWRFPHVRLNQVVAKIAQYSFGVYLVHVVIMTVVENVIGLDGFTFDPLWCIPLASGIVFGLSLVVSWVIHHLPVLKKYLV